MAVLSARLREIVDALPLSAGMRVIEIGCGPGAAAREVAYRVGVGGRVLAVDRSPRAIAQLVALVHELADLSKSPSYAGDNLYVDTEPVRRLSRDLKRMVGRDEDKDLDELESLLVELRKNRDVKRARKGSGPTYAKGVTRAQVLDARERLLLALDDFMLRADAELSALLQQELDVLQQKPASVGVRDRPRGTACEEIGGLRKDPRITQHATADEHALHP